MGENGNKEKKCGIVSDEDAERKVTSLENDLESQFSILSIYWTCSRPR